MGRRSFIGVLVTLLLCVALAGSAFAQGGGRGGFGQGRGGFGGGGLQLLRIPEVQKELKMTPEQIAKVETKQTEVREATQGVFQGFQDMTPDERQKAMEKIGEVQAKAVNEILTDPAQQKRFKELEVQQMGPMGAANRKEVAEALKLTEEQKNGIRDIQRKMMEDSRSAGEGFDFRNASPEERQAFMKKSQDIRKAADEKVVALFTAEQKTKWTELTGAAFTFPPQRFGGGRRQNP